MTKLDWQRARKRRQSAKRYTPARESPSRQQALRDFVAKHKLVCFRCKGSGGHWAKTGINARGPWAIHSDCLEAKTDG